MGYKPDSEKRALVTGFIEELSADDGDVFELVSLESGKVVYKSKLTLVSEYDKKYSG